MYAQIYCKYLLLCTSRHTDTPWCWQSHVLLISVTLPHHPASPPMLCGSPTASAKNKKQSKTASWKEEIAENCVPTMQQQWQRPHLLKGVNLSRAAGQVILQDICEHASKYRSLWRWERLDCTVSFKNLMCKIISSMTVLSHDCNSTQA